MIVEILVAADDDDEGVDWAKKTIEYDAYDYYYAGEK